jgi:CheY-like chemotaxis protein
MSSERSRYLEAGMNEVLAKPIELDRLKQVIDKVLAQS